MSLFLNNIFTRVISNVRYIASSKTMTNPIVTVREGKLRGSVNNIIDGTEYYSYKGIPYAQPPVGNLRFKAPLPLLPWNGILDAVEHGPVCPQKHFFTREKVEGSENCLFLNVYTPTLQQDSKIPVMVFIHGGGFSAGSGDDDIHGPEFLLQHDVILVTINYRLEAFGFLCLDIPEVPGNAGLKDQVVALRWVKNNISQFGGDPENVTIFGESAGGASVTYHMVSPMSQGLFHKAILQSGVFLSDWAFQTDAKKRAFELGKLLGKETNDSHELLEFLQSVPSNEFIGITNKLLSEVERYHELPFCFSPVIEKTFQNCEAFYSESPLEGLLSGKITKVPLMAGYNTGEGLIFVLPYSKRLDVMNRNPSYFFPKRLVEGMPKEKALELGHQIKRFYFGNKEITLDEFEAITNLLGDRHVSYQICRFANFYAQHCESLYMYRWNLDTDLNFIKRSLGLQDQKGVSHADDLFYMFRNSMNSDNYDEQQKLRDLVYMVTKIWTDFAKTGNPTPDDRWGIKWRPYTKSNKEFLHIDEKLSSGMSPDKERMEFWDKLYIEAGESVITKSNL